MFKKNGGTLGGSVILKFNDQKVDLETNSGFKHVSKDFYPTFFQTKCSCPFLVEA